MTLAGNNSGTFIERQMTLIHRLDPQAIQKRARWSQRGAYYMRGVGSPPRGSGIQLDPAITKTVLGFLKREAPAVAAAFETHLVPVALNAQRYWPVKTGLSRALLTLEFSAAGGSKFVAVIRNTAPYAFYINKFSTVRDLIFRPGEAAAAKIADTLADELVK